MKATPENDQKTAFWRHHIVLASQSTDGVLKYCAANGLSIQTYYKWKLKLKSNSKSKQKIKSRKLLPIPQFAEVRVCEPEVLRKQALPDPKWLAEFVSYLTEAAR